MKKKFKNLDKKKDIPKDGYLIGFPSKLDNKQKTLNKVVLNFCTLILVCLCFYVINFHRPKVSSLLVWFNKRIMYNFYQSLTWIFDIIVHFLKLRWLNIVTIPTIYFFFIFAIVLQKSYKFDQKKFYKNYS